MSRWTELQRAQTGRTLAEILVAMALAGLIGLALYGMQMNALRWSKADQKAAQPLEPIRGAIDHLSRDVRIASLVECCDGGSLFLHQKLQTEMALVTYFLEGNELKRRIMLGYNPVRTTERTVVRRVKTFTPTMSGDLIHLILEAESAGPDPAVLRAELELAPRLGVMP